MKSGSQMAGGFAGGMGGGGTNIASLGSTGPYVAPTSAYGGVSQGGFGMYGM